MTSSIRFSLVLHNHQPVGNFDGVFEQAYQDSYLPFLDVFESYDPLQISLHLSGPLMEWLDEHHSDYIDRLARLASSKRIEIIGGAYHEPILPMIPPQDREGQIADYSRWLENRIGCKVRGMWIPERVWEQSLVSNIANAGIQYTLIDDFHFKNAGLSDDQLSGYYVTEDNGRVLGVFPGSERLRYLIPFAEPGQTIDHLRDMAQRHPNSVVVFGDDGEKFGVWPDTKKHVYEDGWLRRFFDALMENRDWLHMCTLGDAFDQVTPLGKTYLPDGSYREMTEWALPVERQIELENIKHDFESDDRWPRIKPFLRGGFWRNFKVKYPETNEMYSRMMMVSRKLEQAERDGCTEKQLQPARQELYRGQCNCSYWHGAFGGVYLPHLRNAIYQSLITADNLLDRARGKTENWVEAVADDFNFDARNEVRLASDQLVCLLAPAAGGQLYELDVRSISHNLLATLARRPEAYHRKILAGSQQDGADVSSIHDRVVFKQEGLDQRLQYDNHLRKSLLDHFYDDQATLEEVASSQAQERGDFVSGAYEAIIRRNPDRMQTMLTRTGTADGLEIKISKGVTIEAGQSYLQIDYLLEGLPQDRPLHFGVEFNFAGMPSGADDRFFYQGQQRLGQLGTKLDLQNVQSIGLVDQWLGLDVQWTSDRPTHLWTFPIETVSQSEGGYELVHQSVVVQPHWFVQGDEEGRWRVSMQLNLNATKTGDQVDHSAGAAAS